MWVFKKTTLLCVANRLERRIRSVAVSAESLQSFKQKEPSDRDSRKDREEERQELQTSTAHSKGVAKSRAQRAQPRGETPTALSRMPVVQAPQLTSTPPWYLFFRSST